MKKTKRKAPKAKADEKKLRLVREIVNAHLDQVVGGGGVAAKEKGLPTHPCWCA